MNDRPLPWRWFKKDDKKPAMPVFLQPDDNLSRIYSAISAISFTGTAFGVV